MATFVDGYNHTRCHTGIGLNTPPDVQYGLATARVRTPEQFASNTDPKILAITDTAWINKPAEKTKPKVAA